MRAIRWCYSGGPKWLVTRENTDEMHCILHAFEHLEAMLVNCLSKYELFLTIQTQSIVQDPDPPLQAILEQP